jgi:hypothetical protein
MEAFLDGKAAQRSFLCSIPTEKYPQRNAIAVGTRLVHRLNMEGIVFELTSNSSRINFAMQSTACP